MNRSAFASFALLFALAGQGLRYPENLRAEFVSAFPHLRRIDSGPATLLYPAGSAQVVNKKRSALPSSHQLYLSDGLNANDVVLVRGKINGTDEAPYYVVFTEGPSTDYGFYVVSEAGEEGQQDLPGEVMALLGDGSAYTLNRTNSTFAKRRLWRFANGSFREIRPPYYLVGIRSTTLVPVTLYEAPRNGDVVMQLGRNTPVEVLITDDINTDGVIVYLVKTASGVVGWARVPVTQYRATVLAGIFFWGD